MQVNYSLIATFLSSLGETTKHSPHQGRKITYIVLNKHRTRTIVTDTILYTGNVEQPPKNTLAFSLYFLMYYSFTIVPTNVSGIYITTVQLYITFPTVYITAVHGEQF